MSSLSTPPPLQRTDGLPPYQPRSGVTGGVYGPLSQVDVSVSSSSVATPQHVSWGPPETGSGAVDLEECCAARHPFPLPVESPKPLPINTDKPQNVREELHDEWNRGRALSGEPAALPPTSTATPPPAPSQGPRPVQRDTHPFPPMRVPFSAGAAAGGAPPSVTAPIATSVVAQQKARLQELVCDLQCKNAALDELRLLFEELRCNYDEVAQEVSNKSLALESLQQYASALEEKSRQSAAEIQVLQERVSQQDETWMRQTSGLRKELDILTGERTELERKQLQWMSDAQFLKAERDKLHTIISDLEGKLREQKKDVTAEVEERFRTVYREKEDLLRVRELEVRREAERIEEGLHAISEENAKHRENEKLWTWRLSEAERLVALKEKMRAELETSLRNLRAQAAQMDSAMKDERDTYERRHQMLESSYRAQVSEVQKLHQQARDDYERLAQESREERRRLERQMQMQRDEQVERVAKLEAASEAGRKTLQDVRLELDAARDTNARLEASIVRYRREAEVLLTGQRQQHETLEQVRAELAQREAQVVRYEKRVQLLLTKLSMAEKEAEMIRCVVERASWVRDSRYPAELEQSRLLVAWGPRGDERATIRTKGSPGEHHPTKDTSPFRDMVTSAPSAVERHHVPRAPGEKAAVGRQTAGPVELGVSYPSTSQSVQRDNPWHTPSPMHSPSNHHQETIDRTAVAAVEESDNARPATSSPSDPFTNSDVHQYNVADSSSHEAPFRIPWSLTRVHGRSTPALRTPAGSVGLSGSRVRLPAEEVYFDEFPFAASPPLPHQQKAVLSPRFRASPSSVVQRPVVPPRSSLLRRPPTYPVDEHPAQHQPTVAPELFRVRSVPSIQRIQMPSTPIRISRSVSSCSLPANQHRGQRTDAGTVVSSGFDNLLQRTEHDVVRQVHICPSASTASATALNVTLPAAEEVVSKATTSPPPPDSLETVHASAIATPTMNLSALPYFSHAVMGPQQGCSSLQTGSTAPTASPVNLDEFVARSGQPLFHSMDSSWLSGADAGNHDQASTASAAQQSCGLLNVSTPTVARSTPPHTMPPTAQYSLRAGDSDTVKTVLQRYAVLRHNSEQRVQSALVKLAERQRQLLASIELSQSPAVSTAECDDGTGSVCEKDDEMKSGASPVLPARFQSDHLPTGTESASSDRLSALQARFAEPFPL